MTILELRNVSPCLKMVKDIRVRLLTVFLWLLLVQHTLSVPDSSGFCGKCGSETVDGSCQFQLENRTSSQADCRVKYLPCNSKGCKEWTFEGSPGQGSVKLAAYSHTQNGYYRPAINITFLHINWSSLRFRITPNNQNSSKNICREFHLTVKVPDTQQIYYDCPWAGPHDNDYNGQNYNIEYETSSDSGPVEYGKLSLEIPSHLEDVKDIKNLTLFVYVDMINAPSLTVHWTAPCSLEEVKYDVHSYIVTLHYSTSPGSSNEDIQVLSEVEANQDLQFTHNLGTTAGAYRFGVQIVDPACGTNGCRVSFSPTITSEGHSLHFLITVILCSLLIPVVLCILYVLVKYLKFKPPPEKDVKPPVVLIIYIPTHKAHIRVVKELAIYLSSYCGVEILLHDIDVPRDNVEELQSWFSDAYERANFVMVVSSPFQHTALRETIYVNAGEIGLKFLRLNFVNPNIPPENFLCVVLSYCSKQDLPRDVIHFRRFSLMHDLDEMLRHLQSKWGGVRGKVLRLLRSEVPGGSTQYKVHGRKLAASIAEASIEIHKDDVVCPVAVHSGEHADSTLCSPQSVVIPEVQEEANTLLDHYPEAEHHARVHSPFFPSNVLSALQVENNQPSRKPTTRRFINPGMKL